MHSIAEGSVATLAGDVPAVLDDDFTPLRDEGIVERANRSLAAVSTRLPEVATSPTS
ncbi:hypothetical protein [Antrihabitans cavernicola]|uniref:hypothetical protein n=1 Tax=Antrihabitans cavernicola TaxID=2495913 RepID=UPI001658E831|nr:hypothetical protein [Spelaeibacter cavernicola]